MNINYTAYQGVYDAELYKIKNDQYELIDTMDEFSLDFKLQHENGCFA